jgi:transcriptional regulator with XRE-family HTH domain
VSTDPMIDLGREVVADGRLKILRESLGLTRNAMAEFLHTAPLTYSSWEKRPVTLRPQTADRIGRFYISAMRSLDAMMDAGHDPSKLIPFHLVATQLGIPQEQLLHRYREGQIEAIDAGILGLWVQRSVLDELRAR